MKHVIRVSRQNLTRCAACDAHIQLSPAVRETQCPFCGESLVVGLEAPSGRRSFGLRGGIVAASLLGLAAMTPVSGCAKDDNKPAASKPADPTTKPADPAAKPAEPAAKPAAKPADPAAKPAEPAAKPTDPAAKPAEPSDGAGALVIPPPEPPVNMYGLPPNLDLNVKPAPIDIPAPEYGMPMPVEPEPVEDTDAKDGDTTDTKDDGEPDKDIGAVKPIEVKPAPRPPMMAKYGLPPSLDKR